MTNHGGPFGGMDMSKLLGSIPDTRGPDLDPGGESHAEMMRIAEEGQRRNEKNDGNMEATAQALADMLAITQVESEAARERDRLARERDAAAKARDEAARKSQKWNLRVAIGSFIAAVLAVIAPFVIEAIKGWQ